MNSLRSGSKAWNSKLGLIEPHICTGPYIPLTGAKRTSSSRSSMSEEHAVRSLGVRSLGLRVNNAKSLLSIPAFSARGLALVV